MLYLQASYISKLSYDNVDSSSSTGWYVLFVIIVCIGLYYMYRYFNYTRLKLPKNFLMKMEDLEYVIPIFRSLVKRPTKEIILDFSQVKDIDEGAFLALMAQAQKAEDLKSEKDIKIEVATIKSNKVWTFLSKNRNYKHKHLDLSKNNLKAESDNQVSPDDIDDFVLELYNLGFVTYYEPFYDFLIELIGNAVEHGILQKNINWWLWRERDMKDKCYRYVFVDMGIGILRSYEKAKIVPWYFFRDKCSFLIEALNGQWGSTTRDPGRGRGLPQIKEYVEKEYVSDFVLITNCVSLQYKNGKFITKKVPDFVGTYCSWSISKKNYNAWKSS